MTFASSQVAFTKLGPGAWGSYRLVIGGKDVTYYRDVPAEIGSYQLTEPYSYGPADFNLPQLTMFEVDQWGTGSLKWFDVGKPVRLVQVDATGARVRTVWRGFVSIPNVTAAGVAIHCEGEAQGRLSLLPKPKQLIAQKRTVGQHLFNAFNDVRLTLTPYLGGHIGVDTDGSGFDGSDHLSYCNSLLAATIDTDGSQYTITHRDTQGDYHLALKDTTTVGFTAFIGAHGVDPDLQRDISEEPTTIYGSGVAPDGLVWMNAKVPGMAQGVAAPYPFTDSRNFSAGTTDADTDTGDGVSLMLMKLVGEGYLDRRDHPGGFDADATEAIKDLQDDAGLTQSGTMTTATWAALWDQGATGFSILRSFVKPLAQASRVRKWHTSANGTPLKRNPDFDPSVVEVGFNIDYGTACAKSRARQNARGQRARVDNSKNWAGTVTLTSDVLAGSRTHGQTGNSAQAMSRLDIVPGSNMMLRNFDGDTLFHVSVVNVGGDLSVQLGVDTQARDAATLGEVIARNIESRIDPARAWKRQRRANVNARQVEFSEVGGLLFNKVTCTGGQWTVFPVVAGDAGSVSQIRVETADPTQFALAITAQRVTAGYWNKKVPNPLVGAGLDGVSLQNGGSGYTTASVSISGGGGSGATATATVSGGQVTALNLTSAGSGYNFIPDVTISGDGTGAEGSASFTAPTPWESAKIATLIDKDRALLGGWGDGAQPCGYGPHGKLVNAQGKGTGDPVTGVFLEQSGFDYHTFDQPVLYVAIFTKDNTHLEPQRILWDLLQTA